MTVLEGSAPVSEMQSYMSEVVAYTHGQGKLVCEVEGYAPCHNAQKVLALELLTASQALWLRGDERLSPATAAVYRLIRTEVPPIERDVAMYPLENAVEKLVSGGAVVRAAESVSGELK